MLYLIIGISNDLYPAVVAAVILLIVLLRPTRAPHALYAFLEAIFAWQKGCEQLTEYQLANEGECLIPLIIIALAVCVIAAALR